MVGDEAITITINGDADLEGNTTDHFGSTEYLTSDVRFIVLDQGFKEGDIIFCQANDVPPYSLLQYNNEDAGDSFQNRLKQVREVNFFIVPVKNQDIEVIPKTIVYYNG